MTDTRGNVIGAAPKIESEAEDPQNQMPLEYKVLESAPA